MCIRKEHCRETGFFNAMRGRNDPIDEQPEEKPSVLQEKPSVARTA
jgi:hypothetical protein